MRSLSKSLECPKESAETVQRFAHFFWLEKVTKYSCEKTYPGPAGQNPTFDYMWNFNFCYKWAVYFLLLLLFCGAEGSQTADVRAMTNTRTLAAGNTRSSSADTPFKTPPTLETEAGC